MLDLYLEFPTIARKQDAIDYINEFIEYESIIHGVGGLDSEASYESWLEYVNDANAGINLKPNHVAGSTYFIVRRSNNMIVGMTNIRHYLNEFLLEKGYGHIGYSIRPTQRLRGYATALLSLTLYKCKELGIKTIHVGCDKDNIGSRRTIERNNGKLYREIDHDGTPYLEFVIDNKL